MGELETRKEKSADELREIAKGIWAGKFFTSGHVNERELDLVFPVLRMMDAKQAKRLQEEGVFFIYEELEKAAPRTVNGLPMFFSFKFLTKAETNIMNEEYRKIVETLGDPV